MAKRKRYIARIEIDPGDGTEPFWLTVKLPDHPTYVCETRAQAEQALGAAFRRMADMIRGHEIQEKKA